MSEQAGGQVIEQGKIELVTLAVRVDGKPYLVAMPQDKLRIVVSIATGLCENGALPLLPAPGVKFLVWSQAVEVAG
jgi:hypothetical protein